MRISSEYGFYEISSLPGCANLAVSHTSTIYPQFRGNGHGLRIAQERLEFIKNSGYGAVVATVRSGNVAQERLMFKLGWKPLLVFHNVQTDNDVHLFGRVL